MKFIHLKNGQKTWIESTEEEIQMDGQMEAVQSH